MLAGAAPASAGELMSTTVGAEQAVDRSCLTQAPAGTAGVAQRQVRMPNFGWFTVTLDAASGDWDLGVFDTASGRRMTGGTSFGAHEVAQTLVPAGRTLTIQACRRSGAGSAQLSVGSRTVPQTELVKPQLVAVSTPTRAREQQLLRLGLDVTEHGGKGFLGVVLYGKADALLLTDKNFQFKVLQADMAAQDRRDRAADRRYARSVRASALPSGRDTYRKLEDYTNEMKALAEANPNLVKPLVLPFETYLGRKVEGIEITENVKARDGKPVFLQMGIHHAREWPSGEHAMEWAYELVNGYRNGDGRTRRLVQDTRTIVVPIVNPDGFNTSREAGEMNGGGAGREGPDETANLAIPYEYHRKNCRIVDPSGPDPEQGDCTQQPALGISQFGVDPNRNYGGLWGGPGNSPSGGLPPGEFEQDYRGEAPFSEPETRNIQRLVSERQVVTLITNHTFGNLLLRPPGVQAFGKSYDEDRGYKALGDAMALENGYSSQFGYQLYDTTGTTEDWTYGATGGFGFTYEIGCVDKNEESQECTLGHFHPSYDDVVAEWEGTTVEADEDGRDGRGNREAYYIAQESTADVSRHSQITGSVPGAAVLRVSKSFKTKTSPVVTGGVEGDVIEFDDTLESVFDVGGGSFTWHVNPSTRPIVAEDRGRPPEGEASAGSEFTGGTTGTGEPGDDGSAIPSGDAESNDPLTYNEHHIVVPKGAGIDNAQLTIRIDWTSLESDWDVRLYEDANNDGVVDDEENPITVSQEGTNTFEQVAVAEEGGGRLADAYIVRVNNFAAVPGLGDYTGTVTWQGPQFQQAMQESWTLTCEFPEGNVLQTRDVLVARGQRQSVNLGACASAIRRSCLNSRGGVQGKRLGPARLGRSRKVQRRVLKGKRLRSRRGIDTYCVAAGGTFRIGYPRPTLRRTLGRSLRRRVRSRAVLVLTNSNRFAVSRVRPGASVRTARRRLRGERRFKVGRNTWFVARTRSARLLVKVQGGTVREVGIGDRRLNRSRRATRRFLRGWRGI